jgi:hypothetical protein
LNRRTCVLTKYRIHHPKACTKRLYLPRSSGGCGLVDLKNLCYRQLIKIREYFLKSDLPLYKQIFSLDKSHTALQLGKEVNITKITPLDRLNVWLRKPLHGQFPKSSWMQMLTRDSQLYGSRKGNSWQRLKDSFVQFRIKWLPPNTTKNTSLGIPTMIPDDYVIGKRR